MTEDLSLETMFRQVRMATHDPGTFVDRLYEYPRHCRALEPLERWQARAVVKALTGQEVDPYTENHG